LLEAGNTTDAPAIPLDAGSDAVAPPVGESACVSDVGVGDAVADGDGDGVAVVAGVKPLPPPPQPTTMAARAKLP